MTAAVLGVSTLLAGGAFAQEPVKVGVVQGLSGPPAIVDFGESYLQGLRLVHKDYEASEARTKIELIVYDDEANPQRAATARSGICTRSSSCSHPARSSRAVSSESATPMSAERGRNVS